jgi:hypothetical protein
MATNSSYIQLSSSVLLEYEYKDQSTTVNDYTTVVAPWYLMENEHDNSIAIFNDDNSTALTGNVRTRMGTPTDVTLAQYGYLQLSNTTLLNDYDPLLTDSASLPVGFTATQVVSYDVVRLHLVQGFNYENNDGFQFRLAFDNNNGQKVRYLNVAYQKANDYAQINPEPFIFGGKYYASYIEIKVPALYNLINEYMVALNAGSPTADLPAVKLSGGSGPEPRSLINADFSWIVSQKVINNQTYFYSYDFKSVDLPTLDQFANVAAVVQESTQGDYLELYASYNGSIIDNYINQLNDAPGNDYIILHDLNVYEYVWPSGGTQAWIKTGGLEFVQDSNYEDPIPYRPIIQNSSASAYRIDYTVRLYNRDDSSSIWKNASAQFNDALKYGKYLRRVNLGINPIQPKVYNQIIDKNLNFYGTVGESSAVSNNEGYSKYVTSFLQSNNVVISSENAFIQRNPVTGQVEITSVGNSNSQTIWAQGLAKINMTSSDTFIKFVIYKGDPTSTVSFMDLTGLGRVYLNFFADSGEINKFEKYSTPSISESNGEILFKIPAKDSQRISEYDKKQFTITSNNGDAESQLYVGSFIVPGKEVENFQERKITNVEKQLDESEQKYILKTELYDAEVLTNASLRSANEIQNGIIQDLQKALNQQVIENNALIADDEIDEAEKAALQKEIADLELSSAEALTSLQNQLGFAQNFNGLPGFSKVDPDCPQQFVSAGKNSVSIRKTSAAPLTKRN